MTRPIQSRWFDATSHKAGVEKLKPGSSGWAQISGRDEISLEEKVRFEKEYLARKSIGFDIKIMALTFTSVLKTDGVKH